MPNVLSTMSGIPWSCATCRRWNILCTDYDGLGSLDPLTFANSSIGDKLYFGFAILSTKIALVFSSMAAANDSGLSSVTNFTPMPYFLKVTVKCRPEQKRKDRHKTRQVSSNTAWMETMNSTFELIVGLVWSVGCKQWVQQRITESHSRHRTSKT